MPWRNVTAALLLFCFVFSGCGQPGKPAAPSRAVHLTEATFEAELAKHPGMTLVDFWASWCGPCRQIAPVLEELADEMSGLKLAKVDVDQNKALAQSFKIEMIPCLILFKSGKEAGRMTGVHSKADLKSWIEKSGAM